VASAGKNIPRVTSVVNPKKGIAKKSRKILTESEPILRPAFSKKSALNVQQTAVSNPAISPICD
jgi:hypothetical protein